MGASGSKPGEEGIITVNPSSSTSPQQGSSTVAGAAAVATQAGSVTEPLLQHLQELKAKVPQLDAAVNSTSKAAVGDPEGLLVDIEQLKQLTNGTGKLNSAVTTLITSYQSWHNENVKLLTTNQEYIHRVMDQAESKADKAVRHVQLQTSRMRNMAAALKEAEGLPGILAQITASTAVLQEQLQQLEQQQLQQQLQQQQQRQGKPPAAAAAAAAAAACPGSNYLFRRSPSPIGKGMQQQQQNHNDYGV